MECTFGTELFETVVRMVEELNEADRSIFGRDQENLGAPKGTSTGIFISQYQGPHIWKFLPAHSDFELQLFFTQSILSISRRGADVAVRIRKNT